MPTNKPTRKQLFNAALSVEGITAARWAGRQGITPAYLSMIVNQKRPHDGIVAKIDRYIAKHLGNKTALAS